MEDITMPDYKEWARSLVWGTVSTPSFRSLPIIRLACVESALKLAFEQGVALGKRQPEGSTKSSYKGVF